MTSRGLRTAGAAAVPYWANGGSGSDVGRAEEPGGYALTSVCAHLADIPSDSQKWASVRRAGRLVVAARAGRWSRLQGPVRLRAIAGQDIHWRPSLLLSSE